MTTDVLRDMCLGSSKYLSLTHSCLALVDNNAPPTRSVVASPTTRPPTEQPTIYDPSGC